MLEHPGKRVNSMKIVSYTYTSAATLSSHAKTEYTKLTLSENSDLWGIPNTNKILSKVTELVKCGFLWISLSRLSSWGDSQVPYNVRNHTAH